MARLAPAFSSSSYGDGDRDGGQGGRLVRSAVAENAVGDRTDGLGAFDTHRLGPQGVEQCRDLGPGSAPQGLRECGRLVLAQVRGVAQYVLRRADLLEGALSGAGRLGEQS
ncbi:hypothetical protein ACFYNN_21270 [Streptomyces sp. NPDC006978]|uniref:hypothetical protein n=1 Tax=unclassified Streptomyces TaxID=2593676 RepID=UPI002AFFB82A|nr:hypothetical protein [Streptomyces sp. S584]